MPDIITLNGNVVTSSGNALTMTTRNWMGKNPELLKEVFTLDTTLGATNYASWTPSTTASTIRASSTISTKETINLVDYDYILVWKSDCNISYDNTWSINAASCLREVTFWTQGVYRRPANPTTVVERTYNYAATTQNIYQVQYCLYYNTTPALALANTTYSPCYISSVTAPTFSSTSVDSPTLTIKTPVLSARCSSTYFSTDNAAKVDQTKTTVKMRGYLYRVEVGTSAIRSCFDELVNLYNNPL